MMVAAKAWSGRFQSRTDPQVERFTESISLDHRLFRHDIRASIAHARMLERCHLISEAECQQIVLCLSEIQADIEAGRFEFVVELEDVHMHIEAALIEKLGDVGRKLHTARSRNDQVATSMKLWVREAFDRIELGIRKLQRAFVACADRERDLIVPGYSHLQRAQPVLASHYLLAYVEKLDRDRSRLRDGRARLNSLPLGSAALAGTSLPIDREYVARELGFDSIAANSMDVSSDRDFVIEAVFVLTLIAEHLSGWAEEWILWSTQEFGFLALPDAICTGSSIMPQKKNPDVLELIRGKTARVIGALSSLLALVKSLPLAYNRDLQEDKRPLFDAFDTVEACLAMASLVVQGVRFRREAIEARLDEGFLDATTLMEALILKGVPQRSAHQLVGRLVARCEELGRSRLLDLSDEELAAIDPILGPWTREVLGVSKSVQAFRSQGSTAPREVERRLQWWKEQLKEPEEPQRIPS
jgi:argininosuccinate lyase